MAYHCARCFVIFLTAGATLAEIFSTDQLHPLNDNEITPRQEHHSTNFGYTILLIDKPITAAGHLVGFKFYHHDSASTSEAVYLGVWRHSSGTTYTLLQGQTTDTARTLDGSTTATTGEKVVYLDSPVLVQNNDVIGISCRYETLVAYDNNPYNSYTYYTVPSDSYPPAPGGPVAFNTESLPERTTSLQAIIDVTYYSSSCEFRIAPWPSEYKTLDSPLDTNNGQNYPNDASKCWILRGPQESVGLTISAQTFETESGYDILAIDYFDGHGTTTNTYSGSDFGGDLQTSSPYATLTFTTDSRDTRSGFQLLFGSGDRDDSSSSSSDDGTRIGIIVGAVLGVLLFFVIFGVVCCYLGKTCCFTPTKSNQVRSSYPNANSSYGGNPNICYQQPATQQTQAYRPQAAQPQGPLPSYGGQYNTATWPSAFGTGYSNPAPSAPPPPAYAPEQTGYGFSSQPKGGYGVSGQNNGGYVPPPAFYNAPLPN